VVVEEVKGRRSPASATAQYSRHSNGAEQQPTEQHNPRSTEELSHNGIVERRATINPWFPQFHSQGD